MKVLVVPKRSIPGILPNNKWINGEMVLDLNKTEIRHCMCHGYVYDEHGNYIDERYLDNIDKLVSTPKVTVVKEENPLPEVAVITSDTTESEPLIIDMSKEDIPEVVTTGIIGHEIIEETPAVEEVAYAIEEIKEEVKEELYYNLEVASISKVDEYIILVVEMNSNAKLEGNLYGLFTITSGARPSVEFNVGNEWFKFNSKFADFTCIENEAKFIFRFIPRNENPFAYRILIKEASEVLTKLEGTINPNEN